MIKFIRNLFRQKDISINEPYIQKIHLKDLGFKPVVIVRTMSGPDVPVLTSAGWILKFSDWLYLWIVKADTEIGTIIGEVKND